VGHKRIDAPSPGQSTAAALAPGGACTVHVDGEPMRSCSIAVKDIAGHRVMTIEGLSIDRSHPIQRAWIEKDVPQSDA